MLNVATLDRVIVYLIMAYALVVGVSRGGIHTVVVLLGIFYILRYTRQTFDLLLETSLKKAFAIFFGTFFISVILSQDIIVSLKEYARHVIMFMPLFAVASLFKDKSKLNLIVILSAFSLLLGSVVAIYQGLHGMGRAKSLVGVMDFAGILGLLIPYIMIHAVINDTMKKNVRIFLISVVGLALLALLFNGTRGVWVSTAITILLLFFIVMRRKKKVMIYMVPVGVSIGFLIFSNDVFLHRLQSIANTTTDHTTIMRLTMWQYAIETFYSYPITGIGLGALLNYPFPGWPKIYGHVHNNFLQILATTGAVGFLGFFILICTILFNALMRRNAPGQRTWALVVFLCTVELLIHGIFDYTFTMGTAMYTYSFILGVAYAAMRID